MLGKPLALEIATENGGGGGGGEQIIKKESTPPLIRPPLGQNQPHPQSHLGHAVQETPPKSFYGNQPAPSNRGSVPMMQLGSPQDQGMRNIVPITALNPYQSK